MGEKSEHFSFNLLQYVSGAENWPTKNWATIFQDEGILIENIGARFFQRCYFCSNRTRNPFFLVKTSVKAKITKYIQK